MNGWREPRPSHAAAVALVCLMLLVSGCLAGFDVPPARRTTSERTSLSPTRRRQQPGGRAQMTLHVRCSTTPARVYDTRAPAGMLGMLERKILAHLTALLRQKSDLTLENDAAANALAYDICRVNPTSAPPRQLYELAMRCHGLIDPAPRILSWQIPAGTDDLLSPRATRGLDRMIGREEFRRVGIGSCSSARSHGRRLLVLLIKGMVRIDPLPRRLDLGQRIALRAHLAAPRHKVELLMTTPSGQVIMLPTQRTDTTIGAELRCEARGVYRLEIVGQDQHGAEVLATFPVHCDSAPIDQAALRYRLRQLAGPSKIEAELVEQTNAFRRARGLPPLTPNPALARVARQHSEEMRDSGFVGHVSPVHGGPTERVQRAAISYRAVRENIMVAYRVDDVIAGLADSPAHRENMQATDVTQIGIGVAVDRALSPPSLYMTQLMIQPAAPRFSSQFTDLGRACHLARGQLPLRARALTCTGPGGYEIDVTITGSSVSLRIVGGRDFSSALPAQGLDVLHREIEWRLANGRPFAVIAAIYRYDGADNRLARRIDGSAVLHVRGLADHPALNARIRVTRFDEARDQARRLADSFY